MGVIFDKYTPPPVDEKKVDVIVGLFYDGTSNNRKNIEGKRKWPTIKGSGWDSDSGSNTSFGNDYSNVDKLEKAYPKEPKYFSVYLEGIGTKNPDDEKDSSSYYGDFTYGQGYGTGETGLFEKVEKGCKDLAAELKKRVPEKIDLLTIDVFGFSRGAAAARMFVNEVWKRKRTNESFNYGLLGKAFADAKVKEPEYLKIRFIGIYDTVSSFGKDGNVYNDADENVLLSLSGRFDFVAHLTAEDEHRQKFPLTNIASAAGEHKELTLPGVHSDIGGGYKNLLNDTSDKGEVAILTERRHSIAFEKNRVLSQGWYKPEQLTSGLLGEYLKGTRKNLSNEYTLIVLHLMAEFGKRKFNIPWLYDKVLNADYKIPEKLNDLKTRIDDYAFNEKPKLLFYTNAELVEKKKLLDNKSLTVDKYNIMVNDHNMLLWLRNQYLHSSASMDGVGMEPLIKNESNSDYEAYLKKKKGATKTNQPTDTSHATIWERVIIDG